MGFAWSLYQGTNLSWGLKRRLILVTEGRQADGRGSMPGWWKVVVATAKQFGFGSDLPLEEGVYIVGTGKHRLLPRPSLTLGVVYFIVMVICGILYRVPRERLASRWLDTTGSQCQQD